MDEESLHWICCSADMFSAGEQVLLPLGVPFFKVQNDPGEKRAFWSSGSELPMPQCLL